MNIEAVAQELQIDLKSAVARFAGSQPLFVKYLKKFLEDSSMEELRDALEKEDLKAVETSAHSLKGVCANLGLQILADICNQMVQAVRSGKDFSYIKEEHLQVKCEGEYEKICKVLSMLD